MGYLCVASGATPSGKGWNSCHSRGIASLSMEFLCALVSVSSIIILMNAQSVWRTNIWVTQINIGEFMTCKLDHPLMFSRVTREIPLPYQFDRPELSDGEDEDGGTQARRKARRRATPDRESQ
jgi:hypothetical protein